jgi:hypothetical protein
LSLGLNLRVAQSLRGVGFFRPTLVSLFKWTKRLATLTEMRHVALQKVVPNHLCKAQLGVTFLLLINSDFQKFERPSILSFCSKIIKLR